MRIAVVGVSLLFVGVGAVALGQTTKVPLPDEPFWAWGWASATDKRPAAATADPNESHNVPGSKLTVTRAQVTGNNPPDWFPDEHPPMPQIVAHGDTTRMITACGLCHLPSGTGRIENAWVAGLTPEYFKQQIVEFRNGQRVSSDPRKTNTATMTDFAKALTDDEVAQAAAYFSQTKIPADFIKVVEAATVPKTYGTGNWLTVIEGDGAGMEPIGNRIVEVPVSPDDQEKWRNPHSGFIAYVPTGSVAKGKQIAETGSGGKFTACTVCHGQDLRGVGPVPPLAGRSPGYIARQLYDMQHGNRTGTWTQLMAPVVAALEPADILAVAAYSASLKP